MSGRFPTPKRTSSLIVRLLAVLRPMLGSLVLLVPTFVATSALTAGAASADVGLGSDALHYVALGDSYSSGVGAPPYDPSSGPCARSPQAYPPLFAAEHGESLTFVACSGATAADVRANQISSLNASTDFVTITIGGNDVGFGSVLGICTQSPRDSDCTAAVTAGEVSALITLPVRLAHTYAAIRRAAPHAKVAVLGYPRLFETTATCAEPAVPDQVRRIKLDQGADLLDGVIHTVSLVTGFTFVDVRGAFAGHELCSADSWINGPTVPTFVGPYHPTPAGYRADLRTLDAVVAVP